MDRTNAGREPCWCSGRCLHWFTAVKMTASVCTRSQSTWRPWLPGRVSPGSRPCHRHASFLASFLWNVPRPLSPSSLTLLRLHRAVLFLHPGYSTACYSPEVTNCHQDGGWSDNPFPHGPAAWPCSLLTSPSSSLLCLTGLLQFMSGTVPLPPLSLPVGWSLSLGTLTPTFPGGSLPLPPPRFQLQVAFSKQASHSPLGQAPLHFPQLPAPPSCR